MIFTIVYSDRTDDDDDDDDALYIITPGLVIVALNVSAFRVLKTPIIRLQGGIVSPHSDINYLKYLKLSYFHVHPGTPVSNNKYHCHRFLFFFSFFCFRVSVIVHRPWIIRLLCKHNNYYRNNQCCHCVRLIGGKIRTTITNTATNIMPAIFNTLFIRTTFVIAIHFKRVPIVSYDCLCSISVRV